jgi:hypothetical protein
MRASFDVVSPSPPLDPAELILQQRRREVERARERNRGHQWVYLPKPGWASLTGASGVS